MIFPHLFSKIENLFYVGEIPSEEYFNNKEDYDIFKKQNNIFNFKEYILEYCKNDIKITSSFILIFKKIVASYNLNLDNIYSAPSLAFKIFIKNYNKNKICFNIKTSHKNLIKNSYYGGRCEVYGNAEEYEKVFHYDFSGMYAQCMLEKFPFGNIYIENSPKDINKPGFYYIEYSSNMDIPVLPHKSKINNKLVFTNGINKGLFWFEEILLFKKMNGVVLNIELGILYEKYENIFNNFIEKFTKIREINDIYKTFGKLIINSLYGRMGMEDINTEKIIFNKKYFYEKNKNMNIKSYKIINEYIIAEIETKKTIKVKSNIGIASAITSKARIKLYNAQQDVIKNKGRILYSDTDSIYAAYEKDVSNEIHGVIDWSIDNKKIQDSVFISSKTYGIKYLNNEESIKIKGFDNKFVTFEKLKKNFYDNKKKIIIKENLFISKKDMEMFNIKNTKFLNLNSYDKRKFNENNKKTYPLFLENYIIYK